ncbi:MAG TPA: alcohol dehydrogenase catalytic domain-containing protein [Acidobacteriaceae bacterium]|nr:alcohol dehydrogenase catalytic domain-containing protein [Acidobacteriaceae bacterium]
MNAAVLETVGRPLVLRDIPVPRIAANEVLVRTQTTGICGTDLHIVDGYGYVPPLPHVLGHEPAGVIASVGSDVRGWNVGDRIVPSLFFTCGHCLYCRAARHQQCSQLKGILGVLVPGAMAEYFKVPAENLFRLPDSVPFDVGGLAADAVVTATRATRRGGVASGATAVVLGAGGVGLCIIQLLASAGVHVVAADVRVKALDAALEAGASRCFLAGEELAAAMAADEPEQPVVCVFDCVGSAQSLGQACALVMNGGRIVVVGEHGDRLPLTSTEIAQRELEVVGSRNGTRDDIAEALRLLEAGTVRPLIAARYPLEEANQALQHLRAGATGRIVIQVATN